MVHSMLNPALKDAIHERLRDSNSDSIYIAAGSLQYVAAHLHSELHELLQAIRITEHIDNSWPQEFLGAGQSLRN
jgi:hypothetical protein